MLTPGNHKLGGRLIWGFGLPSGTPDTCPGMTVACRSDCYAVAVERYRSAAAARYRANLRQSRRRDFVRRVRAFLVAHTVRVVRVHTGGDFHSARYARKWLAIMRRSPRVRFYFYTRSWRVPAIKTVIDQMAELPNCRAWYSTDCGTGAPADVPPRVRVAWLMTGGAVRDVLVAALVERVLTAPVRARDPSSHPGGWREDGYEDRDRWGEPRDPWADPDDDPGDRLPTRYGRDVPEPVLAVPTAAALAVGVNVGRWWLAKKGSVPAAIGFGVLATALGLAGGPVARAALAVLAAATDLLTAESALARLDPS